MFWGKKGALLMLVAVALWTAAPTLTCLSAAFPGGLPKCCHAMAMDCPMPGAGMSAACCPTHGQDSAVTPDTPCSPEHAQSLFSASPLASVIAPATSGYIDQTALETPPPRLPSGGHSILRV